MRRDTRKISRRKFVGAAGAGAAMFTIVPSHVLAAKARKSDKAKRSPSDKLNVACVGVGGRGGASVGGTGGENIIALCDVDDRRSRGAYKRYPNVKKFKDARKMFDAVGKDLDAVTVATPDHFHAVACMGAIKRGLHVYCEKPLAHTVGELRALRKAVRENKVITQVGNQGHSSEHIRIFCEWIWDGAIGNVTEVHAACSAFRNVYCQIPKLAAVMKERPAVPKELDWDVWLGPVKGWHYHPAYVPWNWRGWMPFGTGCIGDWICHVLDPSYWALDLGLPTSIVAKVDKGYNPKKHAAVYPAGTEITYQFPAKGKRGPVKFVWRDGNIPIPRPAELGPKRRVPGTGAVIIGTKGKIMHGSHGAGGCRIIPEAKMKAYKLPAKTIPRVRGHHNDWLTAIRAGKQAGSPFDYGGAMTEIALLGAIAIRFPGQKLLYNAEKACFTNFSEANKYIDPPYRTGWTL